MRHQVSSVKNPSFDEPLAACRQNYGYGKLQGTNKTHLHWTWKCVHHTFDIIAFVVQREIALSSILFEHFAILSILQFFTFH